MTQEKRFENKIKQFLNENGCWYVKYWGGGTYTKVGTPDLICCIAGRFVGLELKAENGKPSKLQLYQQKEIEKAGGISLILYPKDFEAFKGLVKKLKGESNI